MFSDHTRPRPNPNGYEHKNRKSQGINGDSIQSARSLDEPTGWLLEMFLSQDKQNLFY